MLNRYAVILTLLFVCALPSGATGGSSKDSGDWWVSVYGALTEKDHPRVARVNTIFNRVFKAADKRGNRFPRLVILRYAGDPWAISLKDGTVLLTQKAMEFCYQNVSPETGDSRIAFVLGHELAHLAKDDFWHLSAFETIRRFGNRSKAMEEVLALLKKTEDITDTREARQIMRKKELQADAYGLLYASMAGYNPTRIVTRKGDNFIREWAEQVTGETAFSDTVHPTPEKRAAFLMSNIRAVKNDLDLFHIGVRLYQLGRYDDALDFLMTFNERFPCREVFNNIGLIHYQKAMRKLSVCDRQRRYRFKLSTIIDTETLAETYRGRCGNSLFGNSVRYFKMASNKDSRYLPARVNLSSALIMSGRFSEALAVLDEAALIRDGSPAVLNNRAVALYLMGPDINVDLYAQATGLLKLITESKHPVNGAFFNSARLRQERDRSSAATAYWERFLLMEPTGGYADVARTMLNRNPEIPGKPVRIVLPVQPPVTPGELNDAKTGYLSRFPKKKLELGTLSGVFYSGDRESAVVLENVVELFEQKVSLNYSDFNKALAGLKPVRTFTSVSGVKTLVYDTVAIDLSGGMVSSVIWFEKSFRSAHY